MKKIILSIYSVLFLFTCAQKENSVNITAQVEIMKKDSVSIEYFEAIAISAKIMSEGGLDLNAFLAIMKQHNRDYCNVQKEIFKGNIEMERFAEVQCRVINSTQKLHDRFPFIKHLDKEEKRELFTPLVKRQEFDIEKIKRNFEN